MQVQSKSSSFSRRGYSLADTLIAAAILGIAVSAASSLSLGMNTQDEIAWRVSRGNALLENACALYGLGLTTAQVSALLPTDPQASVSFGTQASETISGLQLQAVDVTLTIQSTDDTGSWTPGSWTGGGDSSPTSRTATLRVYRSPLQLVPFP
jgi:type II secretory pathway pseudopilin PulG